jgi:hypothetical protein
MKAFRDCYFVGIGVSAVALNGVLVKVPGGYVGRICVSVTTIPLQFTSLGTGVSGFPLPLLGVPFPF